MNKTYFIVGEVLFIGLLAAVVVIDTPLSIFIDIPSVLIVLGGTFALIITSFDPDEIIRAITLAFGGEGTKDELEKSNYIFECIARNFLLTGAVGTFIGIVKMLQNLSDPAMIGPSFAVSVLTFYYAIFFCAVCPFPASFLIKKRLAQMNESIQESE